MSAPARAVTAEASAPALVTAWLRALVAGDAAELGPVDDEVLCLLDSARLAPLAAFHGGSHPRFDAVRREAFVAGVFAQRAAAAAVELLAAAGVPSVTLKGPAFAVQVLGDAAERRSNDVDLLVRRRDLPAVRAAAAAAGLQGALHYPVWYEERWHDHAAFGGELAGRRVTLEVHWDIVRPLLARLPVDELLAAAEPVDCGCETLPAPPLHWQLVQAAAHAAQHYYDARGVLDVALVARRLTPPLWDAVAAAARDARLGPAVHYAAMLSAAWLAWEVPDAVAKLAPGRLRDRAARAYLASWSPWHALDQRCVQLAKVGMPLCVSGRAGGLPAMIVALTDRPNVYTRLDGLARRVTGAAPV